MPWTPLKKFFAFGAHSNPRTFGLAQIRHSIKSPASLSLQLGIYVIVCIPVHTHIHVTYSILYNIRGSFVYKIGKNKCSNKINDNLQVLTNRSMQ